jgi:hypothetical protein
MYSHWALIKREKLHKGEKESVGEKYTHGFTWCKAGTVA